MKRLARNSEEATDRIEVIVGPVQVQVALGAIPVEIGHVPVAVRVLPTRTQAFMPDIFLNTAR